MDSQQERNFYSLNIHVCLAYPKPLHTRYPLHWLQNTYEMGAIISIFLMEETEASVRSSRAGTQSDSKGHHVLATPIPLGSVLGLWELQQNSAVVIQTPPSI